MKELRSFLRAVGMVLPNPALNPYHEEIWLPKTTNHAVMTTEMLVMSAPHSQAYNQKFYFLKSQGCNGLSLFRFQVASFIIVLEKSGPRLRIVEVVFFIPRHRADIVEDRPRIPQSWYEGLSNGLDNQKTIEPRKKPSYFPLYWMVNRDPYNGLL